MSVTKERIEALNLGGLGAKAELELKQLLLDMSGNVSSDPKSTPTGTKRRLL